MLAAALLTGAIVATPALAAPAGPTASSAKSSISYPKAGARYSGRTSAGTDVSFRVAANARTIPTYAFYFTYSCNNGSHGPSAFGRGKFFTGTNPIPIDKRGHFAITSMSTSGGQTATLTLHGAFTSAGKRASGSLQEQISGANLKCDSAVSFTAHKA